MLGESFSAAAPPFLLITILSVQSLRLLGSMVKPMYICEYLDSGLTEYLVSYGAEPNLYLTTLLYIPTKTLGTLYSCPY